MFRRRARKYCIADGCRNTDMNFNASFFSLPTNQKDAERCRIWLTSLGRQDLLETRELKRCCYFVCSAHFEESDVKIVKQLRDTALPTRFLANQGTPREGSFCLEELPVATELTEGDPLCAETKFTPQQVQEGLVGSRGRTVATQTDSTRLSESSTQTESHQEISRKRKSSEEPWDRGEMARNPWQMNHEVVQVKLELDND